jgi:hypothetical protein
MILNPGNKVAILLDAWHYWLPIWPIKITCPDSRGKGEIGVWRWMYVVQRRVIYPVCSDVLDIAPDIYYRDLIS